MRSKYFLKHWDVLLMVFLAILIVVAILPFGFEWQRNKVKVDFWGLNKEEQAWLRSDSLMRYAEFARLQKKIEDSSYWKEKRDEGGLLQGFSAGAWGLKKGFYYEPLRPYKKKEVRYFFVLTNYILVHIMSRYTVVDGEKRIYYLNQLATKNKMGYVKVPYIFYENNITTIGGKGDVMFEISKSRYDMLSWLLWGLLAFGVVLLYMLLVVPVKIIIRISKGNAFSNKNIRSLYSIVLALLVFVFGGMLVRYVFYLFFKDALAGMVRIPFKLLLNEYVPYMMGAFLVLGITKAFKKGLSLQKEQEFTI